MNRRSRNTFLQYGAQPASVWRLLPARDWRDRQREQHDYDPYRLLQGDHEEEDDEPAAVARQPLHAFDPWVGELWLTLGRFGAVNPAGTGVHMMIAAWFIIPNVIDFAFDPEFSKRMKGMKCGSLTCANFGMK